MRKVLVAVLFACGAVTGEEVPQSSAKAKAGSFSGKASFVPWSGDWWNMKDGRLGIGWNGKKSYTYDSAAKKYKFDPSVATNDLSPMAKYDKCFGNDPMGGAAILELHGEGSFHHHIYGDLKKSYDDKGIDYSWWGHCNGWAAAACLEGEPVTSLEKNGVRFEVADLKGLETESHYGVVSPFSGTRYDKPEEKETASYNKAKELLAKLKTSTPPPASEYRKWYEAAFDSKLDQDYTPQAYKGVLEYYIKYYEDNYVKALEDLRPDVFHKIIVGVIGEMKSCVVFDITADEAVWNYPAFKYSTTLVDKGTKKISGVTRRVFAVTTTVTYADDGVSQSILGTRTFTKTYTYELYTTTVLKTIKGGKWTGDSVEDHPDFAWFPKFNPTGVDTEENKKLLWGKILEILPAKHGAKDGKPLELRANGTGSQSLRTGDTPVTYWNSLTTGPNVTFTYQSSLSSLSKVKFFEQKTQEIGWSGDVVTATRDALVPLGEGASVTKTFSSGKHMVVAFAYDASGKLLAVDEITVKIP